VIVTRHRLKKRAVAASAPPSGRKPHELALFFLFAEEAGRSRYMRLRGVLDAEDDQQLALPDRRRGGQTTSGKTGRGTTILETIGGSMGRPTHRERRGADQRSLRNSDGYPAEEVP